MAKNEQESWDFPGEFKQLMTGLIVLAVALLIFTLFIGGNFLGSMARGG